MSILESFFIFRFFSAAGFDFLGGFLALCFRISLICGFSASLLSCFSVFLLFAFPASLLFLLLCFSALCFSCFFVFLLLCFSSFSAFVLLCLSTSTILFFPLQSCVFAALLPAPLLLCSLGETRIKP